MDQKPYFIPEKDYGEGAFTEKRSKFTGRLWRVETPEQAMETLRKVREAHWDATHNCWAYALREGNLMRYSDDGEPQGTAGLPILEALRHRGLVNALCVVTRYFGGVLLGTGGLVRAYTEGARLAIENAGVLEMRQFTVALAACPYALLGVVQTLLPAHDCTAEEIEYGADVTLTLALPAGGETALQADLLDATAGRVSLEVIETKFMGRPAAPPPTEP